MYTLSKDFDWSAFVGDTLNLVVFAQYHLTLIMAGGAELGIYSGFSHMSGGEMLLQVHGFPVTKTTLLQLLGQTIKKVTVGDNSDLLIHFSNGNALSVIGSDPMYECYRITHGDVDVIV